MKRTSNIFVRSLMSASLTLGGASLVMAQAASVSIDGTRDAAFYGNALSIQDSPTQFGNATLGQVDNCNGSELNAAFGRIQNGVLHLFLSGNLETNGNKLWIFLDYQSGGQNRLRGDNPFPLVNMGDSGGTNGNQFDAGFEADMAFALYRNSNNGVSVERYTLPTFSGGVFTNFGSTTFGSTGVLNNGSAPIGFLATINNSNIGGVSNVSAAGADTVTTGSELAIPMSMLGWNISTLRACAYITNGDANFVSNQVLGPINSSSNLGVPRAPQINFANISGDQFFTIQNEEVRLAALRVGTGVSSLTSASTAVFIEQFGGSATSTQTANSTLSVPTTTSGANKALTTSGTATSEGQINRSADGRFLVFAGYNANTGVTAITSTASSSTSRTIALLDVSGNFDTSTSWTNAFSVSNIRSATSSDGTRVWAVGGNTGVVSSALGASTATLVSTAPTTNIRSVNIFSNQLYVGTGASTVGVYSVGTGLPAGPATVGAASVVPTASGASPSPYDFFFLNPTTCYVADDRTAANGGGLQKWTFNGSAWSLAYTLNSIATAGSNSGFRSVCGYLDQDRSIVLYAVSTETASRIVRFVDTGSASTAAVIAQSSANMAYRSVDFLAVNSAPTLTVPASSAVNEGATYAAAATSFDLDSTQTQTFTKIAGPAALTVSAGGAISWVTTEADGGTTTPVTVRVTDNGSPAKFHEQTFNITVNEVNEPPTLAAIPNQTVDELQPLNFTALGNDADGPSLTYSLTGAPAGASINPASGAFTWTPAEAQGAGVYNFNVVVSDGSLSDTKPVQVTVAEVNQNPALAAVPNQTVEEGSLLTFNLSGTDNDLPANSPAATLTYSLTGAPSGMSVDGSTGVVTWTPTLAQGPQVYNFTAVVTDGLGGTDTEAVQVTVTEPNAAPVLDPIGDQTVREEQLLSFTASANDPDSGQTKTFSLSGSVPYGAYIHPSTGVFTFRPAAIQTPQTYTFTVNVADNGSPALSDTETITVTTLRETRTANAVWGWGGNGNGELAIGSFVSTATPASITSLLGTSRIFGGWQKAYARYPSANWVAWGMNTHGALGDGTTVTRNSPVSILGATGDVELGGGFFHTLAITASGSVDSWGLNTSGELGDPAAGAGRLLPGSVPGITSAIRPSGTFGYYSHVTTSGSGVLAFGAGSSGQLGTGNGSSQPSPVASLFPSALEVETGDEFAVALLPDGSIRTAGTNTFGQLGDGSNLTSSTPLTPAISNVVDVETGNNNGYALKADGTVWSWGNGLGLGDGIGTASNLPVQVVGLTNVIDIEAGEGFVIALKGDGTVWAWGNNAAGQLGQGSAGGSLLSPAQIAGLSGIQGIASLRYSAFAWKYGIINQAPVANTDTYAATEDTPLVVNAASGVIANDADDQPISGLTASVVSAPIPAQGTLTLSPDGSFTFTPAANFNGPATFTYRVNDGALNSNTATVIINVGAENDAPTLAAIPNQVVNELVTLNFTAVGNDIDGPSLTYSLAAGVDPVPAGASIDPNSGLFTWTPTEAQGAGVYSFNVVVSDGSLSDTKPVQVTVNEVNVDPILGAIGDQSVNEGSLLTITLSATDADLPANTLTYSSSALPSGAVLTGNVMTWTPSEAQGPGDYPITFSVSDARGGTNHGSIIIHVGEVNVAPALAAVPNQTVEEGSLLTFNLSGTDSDLPSNSPATTLTYSLTGEPVGMSVDGSTGMVTWTPTLAQGPQVYNFNAVVTDGLGGSDTEPVQVTVTGNAAPVVTWPQNRIADVGTPVAIDIDATDPDLPTDTITFSLVYAPAGATINPATGEFSWTPLYGGNVVVQVRATDSEGLFDEALFSITAGRTNTIAKAWGQNNVGQLGDGTDTARLSPVSVLSLTQVVAVATGGSHSLALLRNGTMRSWGENSSAQLGDGSFSLSVVPNSVAGGLTNVVAIAAGDFHSLALLSDGTVRAWGRNSSGELGDGTTTTRTVPTLVPGLTDVVAIDAGDAYSIALTADGTVKTWGYNSAGNLGDGTTISRTSPTLVSSLLPSVVVGVSAGKAHSLAVLRDGTGMAWGRNDQGQLGNNSLIDSLVPVTIQTLTGATSVQAGTSHSHAIRTGGSVVAWGYNAFGQVGDGTSTRRLLPTLSTGLSNVVSSSGAWLTNHAVLQDGTVRGWGYNLLGEIGDGTTTNRFVPTLVPGLTGAVAVSSGNIHSLGIVLNLPVLGPVGNKTVNELVNLNFTATATNGTAPRVFSLDATSLAKGMTINSGTGAFSWTPSETQDGSHDVTITVTDASNETDSETITITVNEVNLAPNVAPISNQSTDELVPFTYQVVASDSDVAVQTLTYSLIGAPAGCSIDSAGLISWTPTEAQGPQTYNFTVSVSDGVTATTTGIQIQVVEANVAPVWTTVPAQAATEGVAFALSLSPFVTDADIPAQSFTFIKLAGPTELTISTGGAVAWTPGETDGGTSPTVTVRVVDSGSPTLFADQTFTINVAEANSVPTANPQTVNVVEDTATNVILTGSDTDIPAQTLTYTVVDGPTFGSLSGTGANRIYTPQLNFSGADSFTFKVNDGTADSSVATVTLNVSNVNDMQVSVVGSSAPNAFGSPSWTGYRSNALTSLETTFGNDLGSRLLDPTAYDAVTTIPWSDNTATGWAFWMGNLSPVVPFDQELGHRLHFGVRVLGNGTRFSLSELTFDMNSSDPGNDMDFDGSFDGNDPSYPVFDFYGPSRRGIDYGPDRVKGTMDDIVYNTNATPAETEVDELIYVGIGNAWDATQEPGLTPAEKTESMRCYLEGLLAVAPINISTTYKIRDGGYNGPVLATGTGTVTMVPTNVLPTANSQSVNVAEDIATPITLSATDPDDATLTYTVVAGPTHGVLSGTGASRIYTPNANYNGPDSFTFKATDCVGDSNIATVTISVTPVNDDPILGAIGDRTIDEMVPYSITLGSTDIDGGAPAYSVTSGLPSGASVTGNTFNWTPSETQGPGSYLMTFQVSDGAGGTDSETITITVNEVNVAPTIDPIADQTVDEMTLVTFDADGADSDLPANTLTYSLIGAPSGATIDSSGEFSWTPTEAQGPYTYTFSVRVSDGTAEVDESVTITVQEVNVAPTLTAIPDQTVAELTALTFTAAGADSDDPTQTLTYSLVGAPTGAAIDGGTGAFSWTPTEAQGPQVYNFSVRVTDGVTNTDTPVQVTVTEANVAPIALAQTLGTGVNTPLSITLVATDADLPANTLSYSIVDHPTNGMLSGSGNSWTYTPNLNYQGPDSFTFKANDGLVDSNVATVNISVSGITVTLDLQLQSFLAAGPTTRGITMFLGGTAGGSNPPVEVTRDVVFTSTGYAQIVFTPADGFDADADLSEYAISIKDNLHTLRKTVPLTWNGSNYVASATLVGGNINRDNRIDIGDYVVYATRFGTTYPGGADTPMSLQADLGYRNADISGNGSVGTEEFSFISINFGQVDNNPVGNYGRSDITIRQRISVADAMIEAGRDAARLDRNRDGWISLEEATQRLR